MNKPKIKNLGWLERDVAPRGPYMLLARTEKAFLKIMKSLNDPNPNHWLLGAEHGACCHFFNLKDGTRACVVTINPQPDHNILQIYALLAHEATHITQDYFEGIHERKPATEQQAYAVQILTQTLMYAYRDQTKPRKVRKGKK